MINLDELIYNVDEKLLPYIIKYSNCEKFFELNYEIMKRAIRIGSGRAAINLINKRKRGYFNDYDYVYEYKILNKKGYFGIVAVRKIKGENRINERIRNKKNRK